MKKALMIVSVLIVAVVSTACINNIAIQELNNKAAEYMAKGEYETAMNRLQASLDLDSTMFETHYNLGIAAINAQKYEKAIEALENGLKINKDHADSYYSLGVAQSDYAEEILSENNEDDSKKEEVSEEDKVKATELKEKATQNLTKYLELKPDSEDKETVEALIKELTSVDNDTKVKE